MCAAASWDLRTGKSRIAVSDAQPVERCAVRSATLLCTTAQLAACGRSPGPWRVKLLHTATRTTTPPQERPGACSMAPCSLLALCRVRLGVNPLTQADETHEKRQHIDENGVREGEDPSQRALFESVCSQSASCVGKAIQRNQSRKWLTEERRASRRRRHHGSERRYNT